MRAEGGRCSEAVDARLAEREAAERAVEAGRSAVREAELALHGARRDAARIGGELAVVNQFLRAQAPGLGGAGALADELHVDPGYELAVTAALDGRLRAAVVSDRAEGAALLDRAGADGGRTLIRPLPPAAAGDPAGAPPAAGAEPLADHVSGSELALRLLADAWLVGELDAVADSFTGVAVTRSGRVWSPRVRELRQAPAVGEERVLAERNRREELIKASEAAVQAELGAAAAVQRAGDRAAELEADRERAVSAHRRAVSEREESAEEERRVLALIERRRTAPDEGPGGDRRAHVTAELAGERRMLLRAQREAAERAARVQQLHSAIARDEALAPVIGALVEALAAAAESIASQHAVFDRALVADREAGEHVAAELRECARLEAGLQQRLHAENESLTEAEVRAQRARDQGDDAERELRTVADRLELAPEPAEAELAAEEREALSARLERLARRREQLGPVNPLAQQEYADAVEHVEELERQRADLETALRELEKLITDTDRQIRETFEETFAAAAENFEELAEQLFPGGSGRLRLVTEREGPPRVLGGEDGAPDDGESPEEPEEDLLGVEIEITPAGKSMKRLSLLSGGEKSMTALAFLFSVFLARPCPFYILDEVEAALDDLNINRFLELLRQYASRAQFIVVTHQKRTMEAADSLYGVSMGSDGISKVISRRLPREDEVAA